MATKKPRITVTLEPEVYQTISGLADVQGRSMSSIVSEFLTMIDPVQQKVLSAMRRALDVQADSKASLVSQLEEGQKQADLALGPLLDMLDQLGDLPPHSNTGVTISEHPAQTPTETPSKCRSRASGDKE